MADATIVTSSIGFSSTVASPGGPPSGAPGSQAATMALDATLPPMSTMPRSTVLPRVEMVGAEPTIVAEGKRRYEMMRRLGEGGLGEVVGARDNDIGRDVAVKRMRKEVRSPAALARFAEEVRTIGRLEHPNIVPIHDVGVDENGDYYFVMKYIEGETLEGIIDRLTSGDPLAHAHYGFERRVQIMLALFEAVAFAHSKGIVHRDIKPANIMVGAYGEVVLMDWGIAKSLKTDATLGAPEPAFHEETNRRGPLYATQIGELVGTPAYMSPEQAKGQPIDERSDVYSLCMVFYELLFLNHPLGEKTTLESMLHAIQHETHPVWAVRGSGAPHQNVVPADLCHFIRKGLEKAREDRYATVMEMIERLERRAAGDFPVQCPITFMKTVGNKWNRLVDRHPFFVMLSVLVLASAVITTCVMGVMRMTGA